jgi:phosphatidylserine decarboxylase
MHLLRLFNKIIQEAPFYGPLGPPIYMIMAQAMTAQGGFTAFLSTELNKQFKKMFDVWAGFLKSEKSREKVLTDGPGGWFSPKALEALTADFPGKLFEQIYVCDKNKPYYGYASFDDFFNRTFMPGERPIEGPIDDLRIIGGACESVLYNDPLQQVPQTGDQFWIKGERYSLKHMLNYDPEFSDAFEGGTVYQGFLQTTGYHRWHCPVSGTIRKIVPVEGTYFVQSPAVVGEPASDPENPNYVPPYLRSLAFVTSLTTRTIFFIEADNPNIGLMCFIAIGMTEISTCEATVGEGQRINRGDQLGLFHFGGSSHTLIFRKETKVKWDDHYNKKGQTIHVRAAIGSVDLPA